MGLMTKAVVTAGALTVGGGACGYYAHEYILPTMIENEMTAAFDATLAELDNEKAAIKIAQGKSESVTNDQRFSVKPTGFLKYAVVVPEMTIQSINQDSDQSVVVEGNVPEAIYTMTVDPEQAISYVFDSNTISNWKLKSADRVTISTSTRDSSDFFDNNYDFTADCNLSHELILYRDNFELITSGDNCVFTQTTPEANLYILNTSASGGFWSAFAKNPSGNDFMLNIDADDVKMDFWDIYRGERELSATVTLSALDFGAGYYGLHEQFGHVSSADKVPSGVFGKFSAQEIVVEAEHDYDLPPLSFNGRFSLAGLKTDAATVMASLGYSVAGNSFVHPQISDAELPTLANCDMKFTNVPAEQLSEMVFENISDLSELPFALPFLALRAGDIVFDTDGVVINADCSVAKGYDYLANLTAEHTLQGQNVPAGSGRLEIEGYAAALRDLSEFLWMPDDQLDTMFNMVAPAQEIDGKKVWEYTIDEQSNTTVNGVPLGPIMP